MSPSSSYDVAIVGGSFAGLSAALPLARARRSVILFDSGVTRNRFAAASHGFLGQDGVAPSTIRLTARAQALAYPTVTVSEDRVRSVCTGTEGFVLEPETGSPVTARRLVVACGMTDTLPPLPGLEDCWGMTVLQCPYCHGYELADRPTAVLMTGPAALHQVRLLTDWTNDLILLTNGHKIDAADLRDLQDRGIEIVGGTVTGITQEGGNVREVTLDNGQRIAREVLYLATMARPACDLAEQLGCEMEHGPQGPYVATDDLQHTSVAGVFAAGDVSRGSYNATWAAYDGAMAGVACHRSLLNMPH